MLFFLAILFAQSQTVFGKWKTIDDETGKAKGIVEIYEKSGKIYGKVVEILEQENKKKFVRIAQAMTKTNLFLE